MATAARLRDEGRLLPPAPELDQRPRRGALLSRPAVVWTGVAAAATVLLVLGALWRTSPVEALGVGARGGGSGSTLYLSAAYTLLSPICEGYDALTLLTLSQHAALLAWLVAAFGAFRIVRRRRRRLASVRQRALHAEGLLLVAFLLCFAAAYVVGALVPRPMAALALTDRDELAVDVHSHTSASHDGRAGFDAEANRRWHAAAGFAAAYITDHRHYDAAIAGARGNPRLAGEGTVLLPGIESAAPHSRLTLLGARSSMALDRDGHVDLDRLAVDTGIVAVLTTPASLDRVPATMRLDAVETSDGAPLGLMFTRRLAPEIRIFARSRGLARVAGSNNHGWGRTASAWTVLRIPNWRAMSPDSLDSAIRSTLRHGTRSVRVIARGSTPLPQSIGALVATPVLLAWSVATRLSTAERLSWLLWIWAAAGAAILVSARAARGGSDAADSGASPPNDGASFAVRARRSPGRARRVALLGR